MTQTKAEIDRRSAATECSVWTACRMRHDRRRTGRKAMVVAMVMPVMVPGLRAGGDEQA